MIPPFFRRNLSRFSRRAATLDDVLNQRETANALVFAIILDSGSIAFPFGLGVAFASQSVFGAAVMSSIIGIIYGAWMTAWLKEWNSVYSAILEGGTVYVIHEGGQRIGLTADVGVVEHPGVPAAIAVQMPGVLGIFLDAEWKLYKPHIMGAEIPKDAENIRKLLCFHALGGGRRRGERPVRSNSGLA